MDDYVAIHLIFKFRIYKTSHVLVMGMYMLFCFKFLLYLKCYMHKKVQGK